jgi:TetR/AcrR family transcriptional repressor of nem operon
VAPHDAEIGKVVGGYLDEIRGFFRRTRARKRARCRAGSTPRSFPPSVGDRGIRVLARTGAKRSFWGVARPARPA